jgi:surface antigen
MGLRAHLKPSLVLLVIALVTTLALPALAHSKGKGHKKKANVHVKHVVKDLYGPGGGPPPWAPAHGYRRKKGGKLVYVAPFGIDVGTCNRDLLGAALGGTAGGLLASEVAESEARGVAIAAGVIVGATIGGGIGRSMDRMDQRCLGQVLEHAPSNQDVAWKNPDSETQYSVTPARTYQDDAQRYCREYRAKAVLAGEPEETWGTACRQPDGSWQIVN